MLAGNTSQDTVNQTGAENTIYNINLFLSSQFLNLKN